jgi:hypothetical protein
MDVLASKFRVGEVCTNLKDCGWRGSNLVSAPGYLSVCARQTLGGFLGQDMLMIGAFFASLGKGVNL